MHLNNGLSPNNRVACKSTIRTGGCWTLIVLSLLLSWDVESRAAEVDASAAMPLKRSFETHAGRRFDCVIWGLRDSQIGLKLENGSSIWVSIEHVSKADQEWIVKHRQSIEASLAKSGKVVLTNAVAQDAMSTESLRKALDEEWTGEQARNDNKFVDLAKQAGVKNVDKAGLQAWYQQLSAGLQYDKATMGISWKVPAAAGFQAPESSKASYVKFVLGTLCQKVGVSDPKELLDRVKVEFAPAGGGNPPPPPPVVDPPVVDHSIINPPVDEHSFDGGPVMDVVGVVDSGVDSCCGATSEVLSYDCEVRCPEIISCDDCVPSTPPMHDCISSTCSETTAVCAEPKASASRPRLLRFRR